MVNHAKPHAKAPNTPDFIPAAVFHAVVRVTLEQLAGSLSEVAAELPTEQLVQLLWSVGALRLRAPELADGVCQVLEKRGDLAALPDTPLVLLTAALRDLRLPRQSLLR